MLGPSDSRPPSTTVLSSSVRRLALDGAGGGVPQGLNQLGALAQMCLAGCRDYCLDLSSTELIGGPGGWWGSPISAPSQLPPVYFPRGWDLGSSLFSDLFQKLWMGLSSLPCPPTQSLPHSFL